MLPSSLSARRPNPRRTPAGAARLHAIAFFGGLLILLLGVAGWAFQGGPESIEDIILVLDLTVGGTLLATGALVGRARASEARRNAQLEVLQHAARRMSLSLSPDGVGRAVVEETQRVIDYHNARVYLLEPPEDLVPIAFEGRVGEYEKVDMDILRTTLGVGFTGWVAKHRTAIRVDDANLDPRGSSIPGTDDVDESMLVVPMVHEDTLVGVITLSKLGLRQFDDDDLRLLTILADLAATAFAGASHVAQTRRLADELRQLLDMSSALTRSLDPVDVANLMAEHLARAVGADQAQISDWDRPNDRLRTLGCFPADLRPSLDDFYPLEGYPVTSRVLEEGAISVIDAEIPDADPAEVELLRKDGMRGLVMLPLVAKGEAIGLVELTSRGRPTSDASHITIARTMAHEAAMALENARLYETARNLADRDPLTGFFNHRYLHERLSEEVVRAVRTRRPLSVVMIDLDDFKVVNDTFGHVYGDGVLVHVAELIRGALRASDVAARYGGDEFALILPETDREDAAAVARRILAAFAGSPFTDGNRQPFTIGASIGVATHLRDGYSATELIAAADAGLYDAKDLGGNRFEAGSLAHATAEVGSRAVRLAGRMRAERSAGEPIGAAGVRSGEA
ncbi:MAG TPA: diguanylate cyclase [Candidatus Limnocylindrales bacterium]|nr:diguanylate cyclase [Candidatus Limnocylindrales bacterium]